MLNFFQNLQENTFAGVLLLIRIQTEKLLKIFKDRFFQVFQILQENTCTEVSFLINLQNGGTRFHLLSELYQYKEKLCHFFML